MLKLMFLQVHVLTTEIVFVGMFLLKLGFPVRSVDKIVVILSILRFGNLSKYGIEKPKEGPFHTKNITGRTPTIDVGCVDKIKTGDVKVYYLFYLFEIFFLYIMVILINSYAYVLTY